VQVGQTPIADALIALVDQVGTTRVTGNGVSENRDEQSKSAAWTISLDGRHFRVHYYVRRATVVWPLNFYSACESRPEILEFETDARGIVTRSAVLPQGRVEPYLSPNEAPEVISRAFDNPAQSKLRDAGLLD
jgi:hypothetical protein